MQPDNYQHTQLKQVNYKINIRTTTSMMAPSERMPRPRQRANSMTPEATVVPVPVLALFWPGRAAACSTMTSSRCRRVAALPCIPLGMHPAAWSEASRLACGLERDILERGPTPARLSPRSCRSSCRPWPWRDPSHPRRVMCGAREERHETTRVDIVLYSFYRYKTS